MNLVVEVATHGPTPAQARRQPFHPRGSANAGVAVERGNCSLRHSLWESFTVTLARVRLIDFNTLHTSGQQRDILIGNTLQWHTQILEGNRK